MYTSAKNKKKNVRHWEEQSDAAIWYVRKIGCFTTVRNDIVVGVALFTPSYTSLVY